MPHRVVRSRRCEYPINFYEVLFFYNLLKFAQILRNFKTVNYEFSNCHLLVSAVVVTLWTDVLNSG